MTTLQEFIAEIESDLSSFAASGDIDRIMIKTNLILELRKFGNNICDVGEAMVKIKNSQGTLPEEFKSLKLALKADVCGCNSNHRNVTDHYIYRERIENPAYFDEVNQEYVTSCNPKIITETITINNNDVDFYYTPQWLSLVKGINKKTLAHDCLNLHPSIRNTYPNQITITGNMINTNFSEGTVYLQYNALPTDEDGEIAIPTMTTGDLYRYLENYIKVKIAENLIANNKNPQGLAQLYSAWKQEQRELKAAALRETGFNGLGKTWNKTYRALNKAEFARFNLPALNFR